MSRDAKQQKIGRRRERDSWQKKAGKTFPNSKLSPDEGPKSGVSLVKYQINFDPVLQDHPAMIRLKENVGGEDRWQEIGDFVQDDPEKAIPILEPLLERHHDVPTLYNWLSASYEGSGQTEKAYALARLTFERMPDYLFAKVGMCELLLHEGNVEAVTRILDRKFDLKLMYPDRDEFHISELLALQSLMVRYYLKLGNPKQAQVHLKILEQMAPDDPKTRRARLLLEIATINVSDFMRGRRS